MQRSSEFRQNRLPLKQHHHLQPRLSSTTGPVAFLNPTSIHFSRRQEDGISAQDSGQISRLNDEGKPNTGEKPAEGVYYRWTSRNNRKGRHQLEVSPTKDSKIAQFLVPENTAAPREILRIIIRMFTNYPIWNISWLVAYVFVWGSIIWVVNAFFVWLPVERPATEFGNEIYLGGGITAFLGATIFEIGSLLLMVEAINENRLGCFGWAVQELVDDAYHSWHLVPSSEHCNHHHVVRRNLLGKPAMHNADVEASRPKTSTPEKSADNGIEDRSWLWFPSFQELRGHYIYEIGFLACCWQLFGATVFWISGFTALPGIFNRLSGSLLKGAYWTPQIIGGSGFIISGFLFMLETQEKWFKPAFNVLGWHIGFWNFVGGVGFTLCPAFGYDTASWAVYESSLATFWGSWAFMIASTLQLYESLQKHPIDTSKPSSKSDRVPKNI